METCIPAIRLPASQTRRRSCFPSTALWKVNNEFQWEYRDIAVGIATGYGLDARGMGAQVPVEARFFFHYVVQTGSGTHPASYPMGTGSSFPGDKTAGV
jgi:hypothetical protein